MLFGLRQNPRRSMFVALALAGAAAGLGAVSLLAACTTLPPVAPKPCDVQMVTLNIYAADNINPNDKGNPRPVVVKLYQLKGKDTLGEDLAKVDDVEIFPNDLVQVRFERMKEASVLAGVALFHGPKGTSWKTYYAFPPTPADGASCGAAAKGGGDAGAP